MLKEQEIIGWGVGSLGLAVILNTLNVLLIAYLTLVVGVEPALAGSLVLLAKLYDVVTDLPMGWLCDRTRTRWGSRRPYLLVSAVITPLALLMLFGAPRGDTVTWVMAALLVYASGYTLFNVPYLSMPAEMSPDTDVRTRMVAWRSFFIACGTLFGVAIAPFLVGQLGGGADAYGALAKVMAGVVAVAFLACVLLTRPVSHTTHVAAIPLRRQLKTIVANPHFRILLGIKITHLLSLSVGAGASVFFYRFVLHYDLQTMGLYGAVVTVVWMLSMPLWTRIAKQKGKRFGYFVATLCYAVLTLSWLLAGSGEPYVLLLGRGVLFGLVAGGLLLMGNAMLQDVMDQDFRATGERKNGLFAGSYSLIEKLTSGIGALILGVTLSATGFVRSATTQSDTAVQGVFIVAVIPGLLMAGSLFLIRRYRLDESELRR